MRVLRGTLLFISIVLYVLPVNEAKEVGYNWNWLNKLLANAVFKFPNQTFPKWNFALTNFECKVT